MAFTKVPNVAIRGIAACVPPTVEWNKDIPFYEGNDAEEVIKATGIECRHVCRDGLTPVDLCTKAAEKLLAELGWERDSIDAVCFVTQTLDYINQPNSFLVHERLGLSDSCMCLDFFHGCPGWVVGLNGISHIVSRGEVKRVLYFVGDAVTYINPVADREFAPLFGDAGSVTALEFDENAQNLYFNIITKSSDGGALIRREGGIKHPFTAEAYRKYLDWKDRGIKQDDTKPAMDGMDVFSFSITTVPKSMKRLCENYQIDINTVDKLVLHQANKMIVEAIAKRLKVDLSKVPMSLKKYGNTTQVSIPLTIVSQCSNEYKARSQKTLACAFGAGLASAAVYFETDKIVCPEIIVY